MPLKEQYASIWPRSIPGRARLTEEKLASESRLPVSMTAKVFVICHRVSGHSKLYSCFSPATVLRGVLLVNDSDRHQFT